MIKEAINNALLMALARPELARFNTYIRTVANRGLGIGHYGALRNDAEENCVRKIITARDGNLVVLDVGCNEGEFSLFILREFPSATVYGFEPNPPTYARLEKRASAARFSVFNIALGDALGEAVLFDHAALDGTGQATLHGGVFQDLYATEGVRHSVAVDTVDNFISKNNIGNVTLLKIDTEGNELNVLKGARGAIEAGKIEHILFEFNSMNLVSDVKLKDFYGLLGSAYKLYRILPNSLLPLGDYSYENEIYEFQNIIAIRK